MNQDWRLKEHNLELGGTYLLDVPTEWLTQDIGADEWNGKTVIIVRTNLQFAYWVEVKLKDEATWTGEHFATEPEWLKPIQKLCTCELSLLMCRGCQCGGH